MTDRPILFSAPMVKALLAGRKTQTRRVLRAKPGMTITDATVDAGPAGGGIGRRLELPVDKLKVPFAVGDSLWVREAWHAARSLDITPPRDIPRDADIEHAATARNYAEIGLKGKLRPGMFLPRWASRLTLTAIEVRVQRLQEISETDAAAEGLEQWTGGYHLNLADGSAIAAISARDCYKLLWNRLNKPRGYGWEANPWVCAVSFRCSPHNIDHPTGEGICDCGLEKDVDGASLRAGRSVGCISCHTSSGPARRHGEKRTRLYTIWSGMIRRCENPNEPAYPLYGGRGITICPEWRASFEAFRDWARANGYAENLTIDRYPNQGGDYRPENCRWATYAQQNRNYRRNRPVIYQGRTVLVCDLAIEVGLPQDILKNRIFRYGWDIERAANTPVQPRGGRR